MLAESEAATRLSVAFDSVTLYGDDPARRPDIFGKIGEGGVSIATLDDMCELFKGFRLTDPATSVSMTINGPAPVILAMFLNAAVRQEVQAFEDERGRPPAADEYEEVKARTLQTVRGTVQADILKEDQAQNTCIFSTGFALRLMGDVQEFFIRKGVRNFYSVSISATTSPRRERTRSPSSLSPWPTASPTSSTTWPGGCRWTPSRRTSLSSSATASIPSTPSWPAWPGVSGRAP